MGNLKDVHADKNSESSNIGIQNDERRSDDVYRVKNYEGGYLSALQKLIAGAEKSGAFLLNPKVNKRICLKIKTEQAPGFCVSRELVDGILDILTNRGYGKEQVFLVDRNRASLIRAGFISSNNTINEYRGFLVFSSGDSNYFKTSWFHDSPMPPALHDRTKFFINFPHNRLKRLEEERKSYLPCLLFLEDVFWLNIAVVNDHVNLGVDGAAANLTIGAISNYQRFLNKQSLAPAAVTEILAIPEIWEKRTYSIIDLNHYQYANGGQFDAEFLGREPMLLLSENPLSVDLYALKILSERRKKEGFIQRKEEELLLFKYGQELGLGNVRKARIFDVQ